MTTHRIAAWFSRKLAELKQCQRGNVAMKQRMIGMRDLESALAEVRPSTNGWFDLARNVVMFADGDGTYADLRAYMKKTRRL